MSEESPAARQHRFFSVVFAKDWPAERHVRAVYGYWMREHVESDHPGETERVAELSTAKLDPEHREAWLFGYRFRDTHPEARAAAEASA